MLTKCHDFFGCEKHECVMFEEDKERNCWDVEPSLTPCTGTFENSIKMEDKIVFCKNCLFYEHINKTTHNMFTFKVHH